MLSAEGLTTEFDLTFEDIKSFSRYYFLQSVEGRRRLGRTRLVWFAVFTAGGVLQSWDVLTRRGFFATVAALLAMSAFNAVLAHVFARLSVMGRADGAALRSAGPGHWRLTAHPDGLDHVHQAGAASMPWSDFNRVERTDDATYVFKGESAIVVPNRAFPDESRRDEFSGYVEAMIRKARSV